MRCFISIDFPNEIIENVKDIQKQLPEFIGKKTEAENLHLTLKFLGEISDDKIKQVQEVLRQIKFKAFESEISSVGVFSEEHIRIVWMHLTNCNKLQKEVDKALQKIGFGFEQRFMSHLTIARIKKIKNKIKFLEKLKKIKIPKRKFAVENFKLKSSVLMPEGPVYGEIERYNLGRGKNMKDLN